MFKIILAILFSVVSFSCFSQEVPTPASQDKKIDISGLVWNKWETDNFIVLSLDKSEGYDLYKNIENLKEKSLQKWGLENFRFKQKCKVVCVLSKDYLNNFFRLNDSYVEVLKSSNEDFNSCSIWFSQDYKENLASDILYVSLLQTELKWWAKRGIYLLKNDVDFVKSNIAENLKDFSKIISLTEDDWKKQTVEERKIFDSGAMTACLFLRKEFGQNNFLRIINSTQNEENFKNLIGFNNYFDLDNVFKRYKNNLYKDKVDNKIPDNYLKIKEVQ